MSVYFTLNGKPAQCKPSSNFQTIFDEYVGQGQFQDKQWTINGQIQNINKATKIQNMIKANDIVECQDKSINNNNSKFVGQPSPGFSSFGQQPVPNFGQQSTTNFGTSGNLVQQPTAPFGQQPPAPFGQQSTNQLGSQISPGANMPQLSTTKVPVFSANPQLTPAMNFGNSINQPIINKQVPKRQVINDTSGQKETALKQIKGFNVQIVDYGKKVILESSDGSFKATFLEENASEQEQENINLNQNDLNLQPENQLKLAMGSNPSQSTKVMFLKDFKGIAIRWVTGIQTKFEFWLDE